MLLSKEAKFEIATDTYRPLQEVEIMDEWQDGEAVHLRQLERHRLEYAA